MSNKQLIPIALSEGPGLNLKEFKEQTSALISENQEIVAIKEESEKLKKQAQDLQVINEEGAEEAKRLIENGKELISKVTKGFDDARAFFHKAHGHIKSLEKETAKTVTEAVSLLQENRRSYLTAQQKKIYEANLKAKMEAEIERRKLLEKAKEAEIKNKLEKKIVLEQKASEVIATEVKVADTWWYKKLEIMDKGMFIQYIFENMPEYVKDIAIPHVVQKAMIDKHYRPTVGKLGDDGFIRQIIPGGCVIASQQRN